MAQLGADVEQLREFSRELLGTSDRLRGSHIRLDRAVRGCAWSGPDAVVFRERWSGEADHLSRASLLLRRVASALERNATEQEHASAGDVSAPPLTEALVGDPLPARVETLHLGVQLAAGLGAGSDASMRVADLPGPQSLVSVEMGGHLIAGAGVGGGSEASVQDTTLGGKLAAGAKITAGGSHERSWYVDDDGAAAFGIRRAAEMALDTQATASPLGRLLDLGADTIQRVFSGAPPEPDVVTTLIGGSFAATATATFGAGVADTDARMQLQMGTRRRGENTSLLVVSEGEGSAAFLGPVLGDSAPHELSGSQRIELEVFPSGASGRTAVLTGVRETGSTATAHRVQVQLDDSVVATQLRESLQDLRSGNPVGAAGRLYGLGDGVQSITFTSLEGAVDSFEAGTSTEVGGGPEAVFALKAERSVIDYGS